MTPGDVIIEVRKLIGDSSTPSRFSDVELLGFVNQALKRMAMLRPDLFIVTADLPVVAGSTYQTMPADSMRLVEIFAVTGGSVVTEVDREVFDQTYPGWRAEAAGTPVNFMRNPRNGNTYFLYPAPVAGITLAAEYVRTPVSYGQLDVIERPSDTYFPALVDATVFLAASVDDEHVLSGRAKLFADTFAQGLSVSLESRKVTDDDEAGLDPDKVD